MLSIRDSWLSTVHASRPRHIAYSKMGKRLGRRPFRKGLAAVVVLAWIVQIILFFIVWKVFHIVTGLVRESFSSHSLVGDLLVNLAVSIVLLILLNTLHSPWWLMGLIGALVGIITGMATSKPAKS